MLSIKRTFGALMIVVSGETAHAADVVNRDAGMASSPRNVHFDASDAFDYPALTMENGRKICAAIDYKNIDPRRYVQGCMEFYLGYMKAQPKAARQAFLDDLAAMEKAQADLSARKIPYPTYFGIISDNTCRIAEKFREMPLLNWEMGEVLVGVAEVVQQHAGGILKARISVEGAGATFQSCTPAVS